MRFNFYKVYIADYFGRGDWTIDYVRFYIFRQLRLKDRIQNLETKLENYLSHKFFRNK